VYDVGASSPNYWGTNACAINPAVGLDASWINPHKVTAFGETAATYQRVVWGAQLISDWINAWGSVWEVNPPSGQSWSKYSTEMYAVGGFMFNLIADNGRRLLAGAVSVCGSGPGTRG
jgi:hypothetical protein